MINDLKFFSVMFALAVVCVSLAIIGKQWLKAIARNPETNSTLFVPAIMTLGFVEVFGFIVVLMLFIG